MVLKCQQTLPAFLRGRSLLFTPASEAGGCLVPQGLVSSRFPRYKHFKVPQTAVDLSPPLFTVFTICTLLIVLSHGAWLLLVVEGRGEGTSQWA